MAKKVKEVRQDRWDGDSQVLHAEDYGLVKLSHEVNDFIERRFREINSGDFAVETKKLCGGCVVSMLTNVCVTVGLLTDEGPETLLKRLTVVLIDHAYRMDKASSAGIDTTAQIKKEYELEREKFGQSA